MAALQTRTWTCPRCGATDKQPLIVAEVMHPCPKRGKSLVAMKLNYTFEDKSKEGSK